MSLLNQGGLGVDMFFILSGFLIAYILLREHKKYGSIDVLHFYRSRFIRIWPVLFVYKIYEFIKYFFQDIKFNPWVVMVADLTFLSNVQVITNRFTFLWSVAVEFQVYFLSPFVVASMARHNYLLAPGLLLIISTLTNFAVIAYYCPEALEDPSNLGIKEAGVCSGDSDGWYYTPFYMRMGPYFLGMIGAYWHLHPEEAPLRTTLRETVAILLILYISFRGAGETWFPGVLLWLWRITFRSLLAACWAYLMPGFLKEDTATMPAKLCRNFLSARFWLPIATISYSMYLMHRFFIFKIRDAGLFPYCDLSTGMRLLAFLFYFLLVVLCTMVIAGILFTCVERPCNNARTVLKSKHTLEKEKAERILKMKTET